MKPAKTLNWIARGVGTFCGGVLALMWTFTLWVPSAGLSLSGINIVTALLLVAFALFASIGAFYGHGIVVGLFFLASFFPVGAFLMQADHWLRWVGFIDLGLLFAAVVLWVTRDARAPSIPST